MNRKYFFLLLVYQLVAYSSASDAGNYRFLQRANSERNWVQLSLVKMCESRITPLMSGAVLGLLSSSITIIYDMMSNPVGNRRMIPLGTRFGVVGFIVGYASVAIAQNFLLKKFEIK
jgi:hypothetical protein